MSKTHSDTATMTPADSSAAPSETQVTETISKLVALWTPHHLEGLTVRHDTGRMLVALLGPPTSRQDYGKAVLPRIAKQIDVSRSELSRMRKFANAYPDLEAFQRDHAECNTWTKVKVHLGTIEADGQPLRPEETAKPPSTGVCRSINSLTKKVKGVEVTLTPKDRQRVIKSLETMAQAVRGAFGITVQIETDQDSVSTTDDSQEGASQAA